VKKNCDIVRIRIDSLEDLSRVPEDQKMDWEALRAMSPEEVHRRAMADPDAQPMTHDELARMRRLPDVKRIREGLGLTQEQFAQRYLLSVGAVRDWEQRRRIPLGPAMGYLYAIAADPEGVAVAVSLDSPKYETTAATL
jgi:putative transcriptional regulator